ncbi:MAG: hypothetical protein L0Y72_12240 [Gemmataceae bacterium]|nr:hypothetical protein [Gemmataceae bacterium]MCI0739807.1 hypothetical protein [Gemmataceae bacterium]
MKFKTKDGPSPDGATAPADYTHIEGELTFEIGEDMKSFSVQIVQETKVELNEIVLLELYEPSGAELGSTSTATLTILDDDPANPVVEIEINEGGADDDYVFITPSDAEATIYASATARNLSTGSGDLEVELTNLSGAGDFFFSTAGGTEQGSSVKLTLPDDGTPVPFMLSGQTVSTNMSDALIVAMVAGQEAGKKAGSVVKVEISFKYSATDTVKGVVTGDDNAVQNNYFNERIPNSHQLGPGVFKKGHSWGILGIGKVTPSGFPAPITLQRNAQARWYFSYQKDLKYIEWGQAAQPDFPKNPSELPANDSGKDGVDQDSNPQSGGSKGHVYDWDAPGIATPNSTHVVGTIASLRASFVVFATTLNPTTKKEERVSIAYKWFTRQSYKKTNFASNTWVADNTIAGDNQTKDGSHTLLSYGLGSPSIDKTSPATLKKSQFPTGVATFLVLGQNFVKGAFVEFQKGNTTVKTVEVAASGFHDGVACKLNGLNQMENGEWTMQWTNPGDTQVAKKTVIVEN